MKTQRLYFSTLALAVVAMAGYSISALAATVTGNSGATVITPISFVENASLQFGNVVPDTLATGTVAIGTGADTATAGGAATLASGIATARGKFTLSGSAGKVVNIGTPADSSVTDGVNTMTVTGFGVSAATMTITNTAADVVYVGATLNLGINQVAGAYTGTYTFTVNYQ